MALENDLTEEERKLLDSLDTDLTLNHYGKQYSINGDISTKQLLLLITYHGLEEWTLISGF